MTDIVMAVISAVGGGIFAFFYDRRRSRRLAQVSRIESSLRVLHGDQAGLTPSWRGGVATLRRNEIHFVGTVGGLRFMHRRPIRIPFELVDRTWQRVPSLREQLVVDPNAQVIRLVTGSAILEWAIPSVQVDWVLERLEPR